MKPENTFSHNFIDLAKMGRTGWRSVALTILLVESVSLLISATPVVAKNLLASRLIFVPTAEMTAVYLLADAVAHIIGLSLACKFILQRPFRSLISTNMTFDIRRCLLGAALYLIANAVSFIALFLYSSMRSGDWTIPLSQFEWPVHRNQIATSIGLLLVMPIVALSEELTFRAWLTQTLRIYIRLPLAVIALVAVLFGAVHTQYGLGGKLLLVLCSLGFSALSLRDQRLEFAIGAHSMMNVCVTLQLLFLTGPQSHDQVRATALDFWIILVLKGALPLALMYGFLHKTNGWSVPINARIASPGGVQPLQPGNQ